MIIGFVLEANIRWLLRIFPAEGKSSMQSVQTWWRCLGLPCRLLTGRPRRIRHNSLLSWGEFFSYSPGESLELSLAFAFTIPFMTSCTMARLTRYLSLAAYEDLGVEK